jgi:hypothetical protein
MRKTFQPAWRSRRLVLLSRSTFRLSLSRQKSARCRGVVRCQGQLCQKHPSRNTATRGWRKTKSGRDHDSRAMAVVFWPVAARSRIGRCRRQPVTPAWRSAFTNRSSVDSLPLLRTERITRDRFAFEKTSATALGSATVGYAPAAAKLYLCSSFLHSSPRWCTSVPCRSADSTDLV